MKKYLLIVSAALAINTVSWAGPDDFSLGPVFPDFGATASVKADMKIPKDARFKISFDTAKGAYGGELNKTLNSAARFINMHARAGVPEGFARNRPRHQKRPDYWAAMAYEN